MIARSTFAGAVLIALAAACAPRTVSPAAVAEVPDAKGPVKLTQKQYADQEGNTLTLRFDAGTGQVTSAAATDKNGNPREVVKLQLKDVSVCIPKTPGAPEAKQLCQPVEFMTDGAVLKIGTTTCTCYSYGGTWYCYGDTCH